MDPFETEALCFPEMHPSPPEIEIATSMPDLLYTCLQCHEEGSIDGDDKINEGDTFLCPHCEIKLRIACCDPLKLETNETIAHLNKGSSVQCPRCRKTIRIKSARGRGLGDTIECRNPDCHADLTITYVNPIRVELAQRDFPKYKAGA